MLKPKHYKVAEFYAEGKRVPEVAKLAGYSEKHTYKVLQREDVRAKIQQIRSELAKRVDMSLEDYVREVWENYLSYRTPEARHRFLKLLGDTLGYTGNKGSSVNIGISTEPLFSEKNIDNKLQQIISKRLGNDVVDVDSTEKNQNTE
jgi:hypothetical protein